MKRHLLTAVPAALLLWIAPSACKKSNGYMTPVSRSSFSFSANNTTINFTVNEVFIQDVSNTQTTLITGQYADTSSKTGSISLRIIGDTTGHFQGDSLLVTYISPAGIAYYNTKESGNYVQIDKFPKAQESLVSGSFQCRVASGSDTIRLTNGAFSAIYQD